MLEATIPSLVDPSLVAGAPEGAQVMSVIAQYAPYRLRDGSWDERREELGDLAVRTLESVAPGIGALVTARQVLTPLDLERDFGLSGGHPLHAEPTLDSWYAWRPLFGHARYRMPIDGLYLAGSGAHPGRRRDRLAGPQRRPRDPRRPAAPAGLTASRAARGFSRTTPFTLSTSARGPRRTIGSPRRTEPWRRTIR